MPVKFDAARAELMEKLFAMGAMAEEMVEGVILTLTRRRLDVLRSVYDGEKAMDCLQLEIDDKTVEMIDVYTPVAADLRLLLMIPRVSGALERVGDQAEKICKHVEDVLGREQLDLLVDLPKLAATSRDMIAKCLKAFADRSTEQALEVLRMDVEVDAIRRRLTDELIVFMERSPGNVRPALCLMTIVRAFERIGDQAGDIAEAAIYAVTGKDVRHLHLERAQDGGRMLGQGC